jgi:hypothetical protein
MPIVLASTDRVGRIAYVDAAVNGALGSFGGFAGLGLEAPGRATPSARRGTPDPSNRAAFRPMGATTRTSGSFEKSWVRSSDSWVRSSIPWVFVGSIVGSFVENRPKCAAIRYISNANGAYSGTFLPSM